MSLYSSIMGTRAVLAQGSFGSWQRENMGSIALRDRPVAKEGFSILPSSIQMHQ